MFLEGEYLSSLHLHQKELRDFCLAQKICKWDYIIIEKFTLYPHKAKALINDPMLTPQIIGKIKEWFEGFKIVEQSAQVGKGFWTDTKLKAAGIWPHNRHERDAVRHALQFLYFGKEF